MFGHLFKTINQTVGRSGEKIFAEKDMHIAMLEDTLYNMGKDTKTFLNFFKKEVCLYNVTCNRLLAELE